MQRRGPWRPVHRTREQWFTRETNAPWNATRRSRGVDRRSVGMMIAQVPTMKPRRLVLTLPIVLAVASAASQQLARAEDGGPSDADISDATMTDAASDASDGGDAGVRRTEGC